MAQTYTSKAFSFDTGAFENPLYRADLSIDGIEHGGASYQGRIFLNNPDADEDTEMIPANGFAGCFHVFGHGGCFGEEGHCDLPATYLPFDIRPAHALSPAHKKVTITVGLRHVAETGKKRVTITVVPVVLSATDDCETEKVFSFKEMKLITYD